MTEEKRSIEKQDGIIYCYTNKTNGKRYVGQTITSNEKKRHYRHRVGDVKNETAFSRAIKKYGYDNFELTVLEKDIPRNLISEREIYWIKETGAKIPNGYNLTDGGEGRRGYKVPEHQKQHLCGPNNHNYQKPMKENVKRALQEANTIPERIAYLRDRMRAINKERDNGRGTNNPFYGRKHTQESIDKMVQKKKGMHVGEKNPSAKAVVCLTNDRVFLTMKEAGEWLGMVGYTNISSVCNGRLKRYGGHVWRYATLDEIEEEKMRRGLDILPKL